MKQRNDIDGLLFFEKKNGLNILMDEYKIHSPDIAPRHISIALTNQCNMNCRNCYIEKNKSTLSLKELCKWIDELDANGCLSIGIGGGEPTLYNDLEKFLTYINQTQMAVTLTTNGSASFDYYSKLIRKINLLRFSLDGLKKIYEKRRVQNYFQLIEKIHALKEFGNIGINYLITNETVGQLDDFTKILKELRPVEILLIPYLDKTGNYLLSKESIYIMNQWIRNNTEKHPIALSFSGLNIIESEILPIQSFEEKLQNKYFMHVAADKKLMQNVFDQKTTAINSSIIKSIIEYGGVK